MHPEMKAASVGAMVGDVILQVIKMGASESARGGGAGGGGGAG
jgi:hypothetical protein